MGIAAPRKARGTTRDGSAGREAGSMEVAVVTGGSRGIGRAVVEHLVDRGFRVRFLYRCRDDAAEEVVRSAAARGGEVTAHRCDVTGRREVESFLDLLAGEDVVALVNNAAALRDGHLLLMDEERWQVVLETGLTGVYRVTRGCLRLMLHRRCGRIVNIGSLSGLLGRQGQANYAAAKGGVIAFTKALAREVGRFGITVNAVVPGWIDTEPVRGLPEEQRKLAARTVPLGRIGLPDEVARVVGFLLSPQAGYISGATLRVDGGLGA